MSNGSKRELITALIMILFFLFVLFPTLESALGILTQTLPINSMTVTSFFPLIKIILAITAAFIVIKIFER